MRFCVEDYESAMASFVSITVICKSTASNGAYAYVSLCTMGRSCVVSAIACK